MSKKEKDPATCMLKGVRLSMFDDQLYFPSVKYIEKGKNTGKNAFTWAAKFILPPKDTPEGENLKREIMAAIEAAKVKKWGEKASEKRIKAANISFKDGDDENFTAFHGSFFVPAAKTTYGRKDAPETEVPNRPFKVFGPRKTKMEDGTARFLDTPAGSLYAPYSGCYVNAQVEFWAQDADAERGIPPRVNATINGVQFCRDGESFGQRTRVDVDNDFEEEEDDDFESGFDTPAGNSHYGLDDDIPF